VNAPPQVLLLTPEPADAIADWWEQMTVDCPDTFNAWFLLMDCSRAEM